MQAHQQGHDIQILHKDRYGYVVQCRHCKCIQVAFNNIAIDQDRNEFTSLVKVIESYYRDHHDLPDQCCNFRNIQVETPFEKMRLVFSLGELYAFHNMLQKVELMLQVDDISRAQ
ncbi:MAG: DUF6686 family protein [Saprospiraceae bacterium]|nr:hypothetical protein [Lewinella sp.]